eukprot:scaffold17055_cov54-Phaeocystis_antarctica.AAC.1
MSGRSAVPPVALLQLQLQARAASGDYETNDGWMAAAKLLRTRSSPRVAPSKRFVPLLPPVFGLAWRRRRPPRTPPKGGILLPDGAALAQAAQ